MYTQLCKTPSDINEHLPALAKLASECSHITEMGVRYCVSTWAFVEGMSVGKLIGVDIHHPSFYVQQGGANSLYQVKEECARKGIVYQFIEANTLDVEIEPTDMLFIDTLHEGTQLRQELALHSHKARKYIVLHDTVSCAEELMPAVQEFVSRGTWQVHKHYENNNGLMIFTRCS